jgi:hypothetical protein
MNTDTHTALSEKLPQNHGVVVNTDVREWNRISRNILYFGCFIKYIILCLTLKKKY